MKKMKNIEKKNMHSERRHFVLSSEAALRDGGTPHSHPQLRGLWVFFDVGWSDEKKCGGCNKEEGTEEHKL